MKDMLRSNECAELLKVLADKDRLRIVQYLRAGPKTVTEISDALKVEIANTSHHLKVLREGGFLTSERDGRFIRYQLAEGKLLDEGKKDAIDLGCCRLELPRP
jgi:ArsR family transcriptional regulator